MIQEHKQKIYFKQKNQIFIKNTNINIAKRCLKIINKLILLSILFTSNLLIPISQWIHTQSIWTCTNDVNVD
jgi:lipopolysaccharide/colanic/teichoic acid biosynthesis glycosyltransferase